MNGKDVFGSPAAIGRMTRGPWDRMKQEPWDGMHDMTHPEPGRFKDSDLISYPGFAMRMRGDMAKIANFGEPKPPGRLERMTNKELIDRVRSLEAQRRRHRDQITHLNKLHNLDARDNQRLMNLVKDQNDQIKDLRDGDGSISKRLESAEKTIKENDWIINKLRRQANELESQLLQMTRERNDAIVSLRRLKESTVSVDETLPHTLRSILDKVNQLEKRIDGND